MSTEPSFDEAWHQLVVTLAKVLRLDRMADRITRWITKKRRQAQRAAAAELTRNEGGGGAVKTTIDPTIRHYPADFLDEFVAHNVTVHFEAMSDAQFWIGITTADGRMWHINCGAVNPSAKGYSRVDEVHA